MKITMAQLREHMLKLAIMAPSEFVTKVVTENLRLDRGIHFSLLGGFESGFGICPGYTTLNGSLILEEGSAVVDSFVNQ